MALQGWMKATVKSVENGDTLVVAAGAKPGAIPAEKRITLSSVLAPKLVSSQRLGHGDGSSVLFAVASCVGTLLRCRSNPDLFSGRRAEPPPNWPDQLLCLLPSAPCRAVVTAALVTSPLLGKPASSCASFAWARWVVACVGSALPAKQKHCSL